MNRVKFFKNKFEIDPLTVFFVALITVADRTGSVPYFLLASILHESGHVFSIYLLKGKITRIILSPFSLTLERPATDTDFKKDLIISISGVLTNLVAFLTSFFIYRIAGSYMAFVFCLSNFLIMSYNLLPLSYLDGGEIILLVEKMLFGLKTRCFISKGFHILTVLLGILTSMVFVKNKQFVLAIFCFYPLLLTFVDKMGKKRKGVLNEGL